MPTRALVTRYRDDQALVPDMWQKVGLILGLIAIVVFPFQVSERWLVVGNLALVAVVGSVALMILTGFAGQISLGHAAFLAVGAYTTAILGARYHLPYWVIVPMAGVLSAAVGLAIGVFALRLKGLYLAIVTIGLLYLVRHVLLAIPELTGGMSGMAVPIYVWFGETEAEMADIYETMEYGPITLDFRQKLYFTFVVMAAFAAWAARNLTRSGSGRAMMAVRDRDLAAAALGVDPARAKVLAFGISSFFAGVAGAMFAMQQQYITVDPFHLDMSIQYIAMIVLGGIGSVFGAVAGAIVFVFLTPVAEAVGEALPYLDQLTSAQQSTVVFAIVVCAFLIFEPLGLFGIWLRIKRYFAAWPFRY
jgi:branched-chain amino acid transport system permease protein